MKVTKPKRNSAEAEATREVQMEAYEEDGLVCISVSGEKYYLDVEQARELAEDIVNAADDADVPEGDEETDDEGDEEETDEDEEEDEV